MNSQRDTEEFIRKIQEYQKEHDTNIFFNTYKSKVERISNNSYFKKFNNFEGNQAGGSSGGKYRSFNNFGPGKPSEFPYSSISNTQSGKYKTFNQFDETHIVNNNMMYAQFPSTNVPKKQEEDNEDEIGEFIYEFVEKMYNE